ncbi:hypothetical protein CkP1_0223 [Citrobacter phage CkP1]|nr:hypothetical protein CkP1_0223 [Citrobacter phage CkP1]
MKNFFVVGDVFRITDLWEKGCYPNSFDWELLKKFKGKKLTVSGVDASYKFVTKVRCEGKVYSGFDISEKFSGFNMFSIEELNSGSIELIDELELETNEPENFMVIKTSDQSTFVFSENNKVLFTLEEAKKHAKELSESTFDNSKVYVTELKLEARKQITVEFV